MRTLSVSSSRVTAGESPAPGGSVGGVIGKDNGIGDADGSSVSGEIGYRVRANGDIVGLSLGIGAAGIGGGSGRGVGTCCGVGYGMRTLSVSSSRVTAGESPAPGGSVGGVMGKDKGIGNADGSSVSGEIGYRVRVNGDIVGLSLGIGAAVIGNG